MFAGIFKNSIVRLFGMALLAGIFAYIISNVAGVVVYNYYATKDIVSPEMIGAAGFPAPTGLTASCPFVGNCIVYWSPVPGATSYMLRFNNKADTWTGSCFSANGDFCTTVTGATHSFNAPKGSQWQWWVHACGASGCSAATYGSDFTAVISSPSPTPTPIVTPTPLSPPVAIASVCVKGEDRGNGGTVAWGNVPGATYYALRFNNKADAWNGSCNSFAGDFCTNVNPTNVVTSSEYTFDAFPNSQWQWWVHACNTAGCSDAAHGKDLICPALTVKTANGGEQWISGTTQTITWKYLGGLPDDRTSILLGDYSGTSPKYYTIAENLISSSGSYSWIVPKVLYNGPITPGNKFKVKITSKSIGSNVFKIIDESDAYFTILPSTPIVVLSPNGGEQWMAGTTYSITWKMVDPTITKVNIDLVNDNGIMRKIASSLPVSPAFYSWVIPTDLYLNNGQYKIVISSAVAGIGVPTGTSNYFSIIAP